MRFASPQPSPPLVVGSGNVCIRATACNYAVMLAQARHSSDAKGTRRVGSGKLGGRLHSGFIGNEAPSAIEAHWRNPHIVPIGVLVVGRWMLLPFRRSDELLIFQDADGGIDVGVVRPKERRDRLRAKVVR